MFTCGSVICHCIRIVYYRRSGNFRVKNILCVNFMALNFRKADRLRIFFYGCEITMETFERELCVRGYEVLQ